jgi:hypothetical protein
VTTLADMIATTRSYLYSNQSPEANRLNGAISPTATNALLHYPPGMASVRGSTIAIDLEEIRVWETNQDYLIAIERGVNGTTPASHADLAYVEVQPRFSPFRIMHAINDDLDDLATPTSGLFQVPMPSVDIIYNPAISGYDMTDVIPSSVLAIQELRFKVPGPTRHLPAIRRFDVTRDVPTSDYPSGMALLLYEGAFPGLPIHVRYRSTFNHFANLSDDAQGVVGLPPMANSLPPIGAAIQLMAGREVKRNFTESTTDPLQLELVLAGNVLNSYKGLMMLRQQRLQDVKAALLREYGQPLRVLH